MSNPVEGAKKAARFVKTAVKFFTTLIGQVVFFVILILLVGLLAYIIFMVLAKDIGKLLGLEASGARMDEQNYEIQLRLANSGYDSMLNAQELVNYYGFEYAVLMDAVLFIEETGVASIEPENVSPVNCNEINRIQWAWLNAARFQTGRDSDGTLTIEGTDVVTGTDEDAIAIAATMGKGITPVDGETLNALTGEDAVATGEFINAAEQGERA